MQWRLHEKAEFTKEQEQEQGRHSMRRDQCILDRKCRR